MNIYLGIDPGDKWVGWARMQVDGLMYTANMGVYNSEAINFYDLVQFILIKGNNPTHIITESYQQRHLGHNRFGRGTTLRFIGALQYVTEQKHLIWGEVPPGNPEELAHLHLAKYIEKWTPHLPMPASPQWKHAHSAWRVIGRYLLTLGHKDGSRLAKAKVHMVFNFDELHRPQLGFLSAPTALWTV